MNDCLLPFGWKLGPGMQLLCSNVSWERHERGLANSRPLHDAFEVEALKVNECVQWLGLSIRAAGPQPDVYEGGCAAAWRAFWNQGQRGVQKVCLWG